MPRKGIALVLSAPSGAGKTTLTQKLLVEFPNLSYSISCTTRAPRGNETDGNEYYFLSVDDFLTKRANHYFAEWASVHGNYYGTPLAPVEAKLAEGADLLFDVDVQGAAQLKKSLPQACFLFILPPSLSELKRRLIARGTDSEETITRRMHNAVCEIQEAKWYDAVIVNDDIERAYSDLRACYIAATLHPSRQGDLIQKISTSSL